VSGRRARALAAIAALVLGAARPVSSIPAPRGYRVAQSIVLDAERRLQVLEDERLTPAVLKEWVTADDCPDKPIPGEPELSRLCASLEAQPLLGGLVRLVSKTHGVLDQRLFDRERVDVSQRPVRGFRPPVYSVTVDFTTIFGSYAGPGTFFLDPSGGHLHWLTARNGKTHETTEISLGRSLKSDWKLVTINGTAEILQVQCMPDFAAGLRDSSGPSTPEFVVVYTRYHFDGSSWLRTQRVEPGFWDSGDEDFPSLSKFPE
jgi:hypothetical protein